MGMFFGGLLVGRSAILKLCSLLYGQEIEEWWWFFRFFIVCQEQCPPLLLMSLLLTQMAIEAAIWVDCCPCMMSLTGGGAKVVSIWNMPCMWMWFSCVLFMTSLRSWWFLLCHSTEHIRGFFAMMCVLHYITLLSRCSCMVWIETSAVLCQIELVLRFIQRSAYSVSHAGILLKQLNTSSRSRRCMVALWL